MLTSTSNHNVVSGTRCALYLKQLENWKKYIKQLCSDTGQQATQTMIPKRGETNEGALQSPGFCPEAHSRDPKQNTANVLLSGGDRNGEFKKPEFSKDVEQSSGEEGAKQKKEVHKFSWGCH